MKLKRCPRCKQPSKVTTYQVVATKLYHNECGNCKWTTNGMRFEFLADIAWNKGYGAP